MSLPRACHFSYPHSLIVWYVKVSQAHNKQLYTAAAGTPYSISKPTLRVFVACDPAHVRGIVHLCGGQGKLRRGQKVSNLNTKVKTFSYGERVGQRIWDGMVLQLYFFPVEELYTLPGWRSVVVLQSLFWKDSKDFGVCSIWFTAIFFFIVLSLMLPSGLISKVLMHNVL